MTQITTAALLAADVTSLAPLSDGRWHAGGCPLRALFPVARRDLCPAGECMACQDFQTVMWGHWPLAGACAVARR